MLRRRLTRTVQNKEDRDDFGKQNKDVSKEKKGDQERVSVPDPEPCRDRRVCPDSISGCDPQILSPGSGKWICRIRELPAGTGK